jgi:hypothetical protein
MDPYHVGICKLFINLIRSHSTHEVTVYYTIKLIILMNKYWGRSRYLNFFIKTFEIWHFDLNWWLKPFLKFIYLLSYIILSFHGLPVWSVVWIASAQHKKRRNSTQQHEVTFYRGHRLHSVKQYITYTYIYIPVVSRITYNVQLLWQIKVIVLSFKNVMYSIYIYLCLLI